jgi:hypothetical protein
MIGTEPTAKIEVFEELSDELRAQLEMVCYESVIMRRNQHEFDSLMCRVLPIVGKELGHAQFQEAKKRFKMKQARDRTVEKHAQRERVLSHIKKAESQNNWQSVAKFEALYADLMGTREPIKVEHVLSVNLTAAIAQLTPEQRIHIIQEQRRVYELAALAEREGLARALPRHEPLIVDAEVIETEGVGEVDPTEGKVG